MKILLIVISTIFVLSFEAEAKIYRYVSEDGNVVYTNMSKNPKYTKVKYYSSTKPKVIKASFNIQKPTNIDRESYYTIAEEKAKQYELDPKLIKAVIKAESNWNPVALSPKGAMGLMQLIPSTAVLMGVRNPYDPTENIDGGVRYLKHLLERFNGNLILALAAYNAGPALVEKKNAVPSIPETVEYVKRVMTYYQGNTNYQMYASIQKEITQQITKIRKVVQEDGTILFTNAHIY
ncbi:MAG: lytic transglycosylase domain-containing protein [Thermodesulfovibrionales bacterium]|nr:lytic transglycosylase domain-containing protein [Thermodesulfovibrionales bacterium]